MLCEINDQVTPKCELMIKPPEAYRVINEAAGATGIDLTGLM